MTEALMKSCKCGLLNKCSHIRENLWGSRTEIKKEKTHLLCISKPHAEADKDSNIRVQARASAEIRAKGGAPGCQGGTWGKYGRSGLEGNGERLAAAQKASIKRTHGAFHASQSASSERERSIVEQTGTT